MPFSGNKNSGNKKKSPSPKPSETADVEHRKEIIGCTITVSGSKNNLPRIKTRLIRKLDDTFLANETLSIKCRHDVSNRLKGKIFEHAYNNATMPMIVNIG